MINIPSSCGDAPERGRSPEEPAPKMFVLLLAAGYGTRLRSVSGGLPKSMVPLNAEGKTAMDFLQENFASVPHDGVIIFRRKEEEEIFAPVVRAHACAEEDRLGEEATGEAIHRIMGKYGRDARYIVSSQDIHFSRSDFERFARQKRGAVQWGVFGETPLMDAYHGLFLDPETDAVIGDRKFHPDVEAEHAVDTVTKGALHIVEPGAYGDAYGRLRKESKKEDHDFYWDVMPFMERMNYLRWKKGAASILQGVRFREPIFDFGTPERLSHLRSVLSSPGFHAAPDARL